MGNIATINRAEVFRSAINLCYAYDPDQIITHAFSQHQVVQHIVEGIFIHSGFVACACSDGSSLNTTQEFLVKFVEIRALLCTQIETSHRMGGYDIGGSHTIRDNSMDARIR